jgi:addiction module RelE/StbE family toxin
MKALFWTPEALQDRDVIYDYIEADNPVAALALDELLAEKAARLIDHPGQGRIGRVAGTRELVAHQNYILVYQGNRECRRHPARVARCPALALIRAEYEGGDATAQTSLPTNLIQLPLTIPSGDQRSWWMTGGDGGVQDTRNACRSMAMASHQG